MSDTIISGESENNSDAPSAESRLSASLYPSSSNAIDKAAAPPGMSPLYKPDAAPVAEASPPAGDTAAPPAEPLQQATQAPPLDLQAVFTQATAEGATAPPPQLLDALYASTAGVRSNEPAAVSQNDFKSVMIAPAGVEIADNDPLIAAAVSAGLGITSFQAAWQMTMDCVRNGPVTIAPDQSMAALVAAHGADETVRIVNQARTTAAEVTKSFPGFNAWLDSSGLGNHPGFIQWLASAGARQPKGGSK